MSLTVKIEGLDELTKAFLKAPEVVKAQANKAIKKAIFLLLGEARKNAPVDRGFLRGAGMNTFFSDFKGTLENTAPYARWVHDGTWPHFPPLEAIAPWANAHNIPPFLVARSIAKKGTKARPFFAEAIASKEKEVSGIFKAALETITKMIAQG